MEANHHKSPRYTENLTDPTLGSYVTAHLRNYVTGNPSPLGNCVTADRVRGAGRIVRTDRWSWECSGAWKYRETRRGPRGRSELALLILGDLDPYPADLTSRASPLPDVPRAFNVVDQGKPISVTVSGFLAPKTGPVDASLTMVAYEGDAYLTGDYARLDSAQMASAITQGTNFFNSNKGERP